MSPKYKLAQKVRLELKTNYAADVQITEVREFYISGIKISSDAKGQTFVYDLMISLPDAYFPGKGLVPNIPESRIIE